MNGDARVVAALALAVLALPPVVNAIMAKAAEQVDPEWLREGDQDAAIRFEPREGPAPGPTPDAEGDDSDAPTPPPQQPPPCEPEARGPEPVRLGTDTAVQGATGSLTLRTEPGDVAVVARIEGRDVTGQPRFRLDEGGAERYAHGELHIQESFTLPPGDEGRFLAPTPGVAWTLRWDVSGTVHRGIALSLQAVRCAGGVP